MATIPARMRVNAQFQFPTLAIGSGPITLTKINGIWTAGFTPVLSTTLTILSASGPPAGGSSGQGLLIGATPNFGIFFGSNVPTLQAGKGSLYLRVDGSSSSTRLYVNTDGGTTWTNVTTAA
jgi:hypothetical protein